MNNIKRMSVNSLLFPNQFNLNAQTINVSGIAANLTRIAPIITSSNVLCSNLYVQRAVTCDTPGNIATPTFTITNAPIPTYVLTGIDATHASWQEIPEAEPAKYLMTDTGSVKIYNSDAPGVGDVLIALSATEAAWGPQSGSGGSNIAAFLETTGAPVMVKSSAPPSINQILRATSATNAEWADVIVTNAAYANVSGYSLNSLHSEWSDEANIAVTALHANVATFAYDALHSDWSDTSNIAVLATNAINSDHAEWSDFSNLAAFAVDSTHTDWADFANSIATTTVTPGNYGDSTHVGRFVVNASGQLTQASNVAISAGNLTGPVTSVGLATTITATGVSAQKYGNATSVPSFTVNTAGQLTQAANVAISFPAAGNLTGPITSVGLATSIAAQTGTGSTFVVQNTPTLTTPNIGAATGTSLNVTGQLTSTIVTGTAPLVVSSTTNVPNLYVARSSLADAVTTNANLTGPITSVGNATSIAAQTGTGSTFVVQTNPSITNPTISQITNTGVLTLPTTTDTLTGRSTTDVLINKTITNNSNNVIARSLWAGSGANSVSTYAATAPTTGQILTATNSSTATWQDPAAATNVNLTVNSSDLIYYVGAISTGGGSKPLQQTNAIYTNATNGNFAIASPGSFFVTGAASSVNIYATTNQIKLGAAAGPNTTITSPAPPASITLTLPNALSDTLVARNTTDTLTNKTITNNSNNVIARGLWQASGASSVSTYAATAGTTGQVLTMNSSTTANWQTPTATSPTSGAQHIYDAAVRATSSAAYVDIGAALSVTATTSTLVLVNISTYVTNNTVNGGGYLSFAISGATTRAADVKYQTFNQVGTIGHANQCTGSWVVPVTAGSNTFTLKFATFTGTSSFYYNHIAVVPLN